MLYPSTSAWAGRFPLQDQVKIAHEFGVLHAKLYHGETSPSLSSPVYFASVKV